MADGATLAKAYVQLIPSAQGMGSAIKSDLEKEGDPDGTGQSFGSKLAGGIKKLIIAAGIGKTLQMAITEGANLEQSWGGIETLFKDHADKMKQYAQEAYLTVGVSANEYMEQVTSFSAGLIQSCGGDTERAAEVANQAMIDMADNANKMGTDMASIQNAYQGFAKQNYTMLDNLKLGYGGTKTEMERLLADAEKLSGVHYDISNLDDVYNAIHVIQENLGIAGTTAEEAQKTVSGSFNSMKASAMNLLGYLADSKDGWDISGAVQGLVQTASTFVFGNLIPMVGSIIVNLPNALLTLVQTALETLPGMIQEFANNLLESLPDFISEGSGMLEGIIKGITEALPMLLEIAVELVTQLIEDIASNLPAMLEGGAQLLLNLVDGFVQALPQMTESIVQLVYSLTDTIKNHAPEIIQTAIDVIITLASGLLDALPYLIDAAIQIAAAILDTILSTDWVSFGMNLLNMIIEGLTKLIATVGQKAQEIASKLWDTIYQTDWVALGSRILSWIINGIGSMFTGLGTTARNLVELVKTSIQNTPWYQLGSNIIQGMINGIGSMGNALWNAAKNIAKQAMDAIKRFFGINSPSTVMRDEVGKFLPEGLAVGITANADAVTDAMDNLSGMTLDKALDIQQPLVSGISTGAESTGFILDYSLLAEKIAEAVANRPMLLDGKTIASVVDNRSAVSSRKLSLMAGGAL